VRVDIVNDVLISRVGLVGLFLVLLFGGGILIGRRLPVGHVASRSTTFAAPPERVWEVITDPAFMRSPGVGDVKTETIESVPPRRLVRRIVGETAFGGTWTSELDPQPGGGTRLVITENGEIYSGVYRFISRYFVGHHRAIDSFLTALRLRLEATAK
jgi:hypothetical protein